MSVSLKCIALTCLNIKFDQKMLINNETSMSFPPRIVYVTLGKIIFTDHKSAGTFKFACEQLKKKTSVSQRGAQEKVQ